MIKIKKTLKKYKYFYLFVIVVIGLILFFVFRHHSVINTVQTKSKVSHIIDNSKAQATQNTIGQGGVTSTNGSTQISQSNTASTPVSSSDGAITLESPSANSIIKTGTVLNGTATVSAIQYRLVDSTIGVIAQGSLNVVNGVFSGTFNFQPSSDSGQLDIFSYENGSSIGPEINSITIPVKFNP